MSQLQFAGKAPRPCPNDFEAVFIRIGRLACEEHYEARRTTVTRWLEECGKDRLIALRSAHVQSKTKANIRRCPPDFEIAYVSLGLKECQRRYRTTFRVVRRWLDECGSERLTELRRKEIEIRDPEKQINRHDIGRIMSRAFPLGK